MKALRVMAARARTVGLRHALVALAVAASTLAQPVAAQSSDASRQFEAGRTADFNNWLWRAQRGAAPTPAEQAQQAVLEAIGRRDCPGAVTALNAGLAKGYPEVQLMAGALFEEGACVRANWERAVSLYQRAHGAGLGVAAARLAAGYAAPAQGPDKAAALWWAHKAGTTLPSDCAVATALLDDPDRFVGTLKVWPATLLDACVYAAGVMAGIQAELNSPALRAGLGLSGTVQVRVQLAQRLAEVKAELADEAGARAGDGAEIERQLRAARRAFDEHAKAVTDRALARHAAPAQVPAGWQLQARFTYGAGR